MEQPQKLMGKIVALDSISRRVTIEIDFFDPDKQEMLETILREKSVFTFGFWKPFRQSKSHAQLKKYYLCIHKLLNKIGVYPDSNAVKAIDDEVKKRVFNCDNIEFYGKVLPLLPSKSVMSWDDMSNMIKFLYDNYGVLIEDDLEIK